VGFQKFSETFIAPTSYCSDEERGQRWEDFKRVADRLPPQEAVIAYSVPAGVCGRLSSAHFFEARAKFFAHAAQMPAANALDELLSTFQRVPNDEFQKEILMRSFSLFEEAVGDFDYERAKGCLRSLDDCSRRAGGFAFRQETLNATLLFAKANPKRAFEILKSASSAYSDGELAKTLSYSLLNAAKNSKNPKEQIEGLAMQAVLDRDLEEERLSEALALCDKIKAPAERLDALDHISSHAQIRFIQEQAFARILFLVNRIMINGTERLKERFYSRTKYISRVTQDDTNKKVAKAIAKKIENYLKAREKPVVISDVAANRFLARLSPKPKGRASSGKASPQQTAPSLNRS
jgi:hypothetical protein